MIQYGKNKNNHFHKKLGGIGTWIVNLAVTINEAVVKRGIDYYESGAVLWIKEKPALTFQGFVQGTKKYTVLVMLDQEDRIAFSSCTCPYNKGPYCKHEAAVYLALQHRLREKQIQKLESWTAPSWPAERDPHQDFNGYYRRMWGVELIHLSINQELDDEGIIRESRVHKGIKGAEKHSRKGITISGSNPTLLQPPYMY